MRQCGGKVERYLIAAMFDRGLQADLCIKLLYVTSRLVFGVWVSFLEPPSAFQPRPLHVLAIYLFHRAPSAPRP